jgi:hypothetical protein
MSSGRNSLFTDIMEQQKSHASTSRAAFMQVVNTMSLGSVREETWRLVQTDLTDPSCTSCKERSRSYEGVGKDFRSTSTSP